MTILHLTATDFIRKMDVGRTQPILLGCADGDGNRYEVVVKFRGKEFDANAQLAELVTAQLADELGLDVPQAAVVDVAKGFETIVTVKSLAGSVKNSTGLNFGSIHLGADFTSWPAVRSISMSLKVKAAEIFAFDALIQNVDRRIENPNVFANSARLVVYDHEMAFAFLSLVILGGTPRPWISADQVKGFPFLKRHVFFTSLQGGKFDLTAFRERLSNLDDDRLLRMINAVPAEWRAGNTFCEKIVEYLQEARSNSDRFVNYVLYLLK